MAKLVPSQIHHLALRVALFVRGPDGHRVELGVFRLEPFTRAEARAR